ncbi:DUF6151 family protein [Ruegeria sp.]|uniref:DUF6151 family protein n=1 Tax=Ruegeria sp. TaxID=1879320 RepID=UPI003B003756
MASESDLTFSCACGTLTGRITSDGARLGTHAECFCRDCRAAQLYFGQPDPAPGPVEVFQIAPDEVTIDSGAEHLAAMSLSPKGMLRWYAKCCNAPLATTPRTARFPFAGFIALRIDDRARLGPIATRGFVPRPNGKQKHENLAPAVIGLLRRVIKSRLSGGWKNTPFFDPESFEPVVTPTVISKEERAALYP